MKKFPNLKVISRDGSTTYRTSIETANTNIIQISDRFHLIKGISEVLVKYVRNKYSKNIITVHGKEETKVEDDFEEEYSKLAKSAKENYDRKKAEFNLIKEYYNKCNNYSKTAKKFGVDPRTVKEYAHMENLPIPKRNSSSSLDKYKNKIIDNIDKSCQDIYKIIQKEGYKGTYSSLRYFIKKRSLKVSNNEKNTFVNRTYIIDLLNHKSISDLQLDKFEEENLKKLLKQDKMLAKIIELNDNFSIAIFSKITDRIDEWIQDAKKLNISPINTFISSLETDILAVKHSVAYSNLSNGLIEGKNCKMKLIKRMMFGRCSAKLLRAKLIQLG